MSPINTNAIYQSTNYHHQSTKINSFNDLIKKIGKLFESNKVDINELKNIMQSYDSNPSDWIKYVNLSKDRYTRVLIDGGNGKYNLMLLCWPPNTGSSIHNHPNSHCVLKVLGGSVSEIQYCWPKDCNNNDNDNNNNNNNEMIVLRENRLKTQNVAYINDSIGLHRVKNSNKTMPAFSLHLYSPPFDYCRIFDEKTGKYQTINVGFDPKEIENVKYRVKYLHKSNNNNNNNDQNNNLLLNNNENDQNYLIFEMEKNNHFGKTRA